MSFRILVFGLFIVGSTYAQQVESSSYDRMLKKRLPKNVPIVDVNQVDVSDSSIVYLDTRELCEFEVSHIENAQYIGYKKANLEAVLKLPKETKIIVYCSIGYRSGKISKELIDDGFTNVHNLYGGIFEWSNQERPLVDNNGNSTVKVHPYNKKWGKWITSGDKAYY
jgi:rhodanese-related sulfurtransferase